MAIHPLETTEKIRTTYINYLKTIKPFQDEELRKEFAQAIEAQDMLVKGPLLQIALPYRKDKSCLLYTSPSPRDRTRSRMPSSA